MLVDLFKTGSPTRLPPKLPMTKRDWSKAVETFESRIERLQSELAAARRAHGDAVLLSQEGGKAEQAAVDKTYADIQRIERQITDARAACEAAVHARDQEALRSRKARAPQF